MMPDPPAGPERVAADAVSAPPDAGPLSPASPAPPPAADSPSVGPAAGAPAPLPAAGAQSVGPAAAPSPGPAPVDAPAVTPEELYELGGRLLDRGEAAQAAEVFSAALAPLSADDPVRGRLLGGLGIARLELATRAFSEAVETGDAGVRPLALELLARTLPLRDRDDEAAQVWQRGTQDPDPQVAAAVRARLRRALGADAAQGQEFWWDAFLESAISHGTLPALAGELFGVIDHIYALVAVPYVRGARQREMSEALGQAVRVPSGYAWGPELQASFRRRLREAVGAESDLLPPGWPDAS